MKILYLIPNLNVSGNSAQIQKSVRALCFQSEKELEGQILIFSFAPVPPETRHVLESSGGRFSVQVHELRARFQFEIYWQVLRKLHSLKFRPDAVQTWDTSLLSQTHALARHFRAKSIAAFRHFEPETAPSRRLFAQFDSLTANSLGIQNAWQTAGFRGNWKILPDSIADFPLSSNPIPNQAAEGLILNQFAANSIPNQAAEGSIPNQAAANSIPSASAPNVILPHSSTDSLSFTECRNAFLADLGLPSETTLAVCAGPIAVWKRWQWAVWSIDSIVRVHPEMHLLLFDPDLENRQTRTLNREQERERRSIARFTQQYEREPIVHFLPYRQDFRNVLPFADFFWNLQSRPGSGLAFLEAAAAGVPIVTAEFPDLFSFFPQGTCAPIALHSETIAAASQTHLLKIHPDQKEEQIVRAKESAKAFADPDIFLAGMRSLYQ